MELEYRFANIEIRADSSGAVIEGTVMPYSNRRRILRGLFRESVDAGAFGNLGDVILNQDARARSDHDLARTDGGGLELTDSAERLSMRAEIPVLSQKMSSTW